MHQCMAGEKHRSRMVHAGAFWLARECVKSQTRSTKSTLAFGRAKFPINELAIVDHDCKMIFPLSTCAAAKAC